VAKLVVQPATKRYFKKLKDTHLKQLFKDALKEVLENPDLGKLKHADLGGIRCVDIYYNKTNYELAYYVTEVSIQQSDAFEKDESGEENPATETVVIVVLAGTRENFYRELKRYWP
jgi:mRNA-degrading endonuclease RelE of RelBE toxin-antitoxin system